MGLVDRAKNMLLSPKEEWEVIAAEEPSTGSVITGYLIPFILLGSVLWVLGALIFGGGAGLLVAIVGAIGLIVIVTVSVLIAAAVINALAPTFNSEKNMARATQLVVYSATPQLVGMVLLIIPFLGYAIIGLGGLYGIYLMYLGFRPVMKTPEDKVVPYMVVSIIALYFVVAVLMTIMFAIIAGIIATGAAVGGMDSY